MRQTSIRLLLRQSQIPSREPAEDPDPGSVRSKIAEVERARAEKQLRTFFERDDRHDDCAGFANADAGELDPLRAHQQVHEKRKDSEQDEMSGLIAAWNGMD